MPARPMGPPCNSQFCTLVDRIRIKQKDAQSNSRRTCRPTYNYTLQCSRVKYQVCAKMFADTFGVSSRTIGDWISTSIGDNILIFLLYCIQISTNQERETLRNNG